MRKKLFITLLLIFVLAPLFSFAQSILPLVQCGNTPSDPCTTCHLFQLFHRLIQFGFLFLLLPLTAIAFLIGGVLMLTAAGNETQVTRARSILWNTLLGIAIAFASWIIINTVINTIASGQFSGSWYKFPGCAGSPWGKSPIDLSLLSGLNQGGSGTASAGGSPSPNAIRAATIANGANLFGNTASSQRTSQAPSWRYLLASIIGQAPSGAANELADKATELADEVLQSSASNEISRSIASEARLLASASRRSLVGASDDPIVFRIYSARAIHAATNAMIARRLAAYPDADSQNEAKQLAQAAIAYGLDAIDPGEWETFSVYEYLVAQSIAAEAMNDALLVPGVFSYSDPVIGKNTQIASVLLAQSESCVCEMDRLDCNGGTVYHTSEVISSGLCAVRDGYTQNCGGVSKDLWKTWCSSITPSPAPSPSPIPSPSPTPPPPSGNCTCEMDRLDCNGNVSYHTSEVVSSGLCSVRNSYTQSCPGGNKQTWVAWCSGTARPPGPSPLPPPPPSGTTGVCNPKTQPSPDWGQKGGMCLPSCGRLGGTYCSGSANCPSGYKSAGNSYDCAACCVVMSTPPASGGDGGGPDGPSGTDGSGGSPNIDGIVGNSVSNDVYGGAQGEIATDASIDGTDPGTLANQAAMSAELAASAAQNAASRAAQENSPNAAAAQAAADKANQAAQDARRAADEGDVVGAFGGMNVARGNALEAAGLAGGKTGVTGMRDEKTIEDARALYDAAKDSYDASSDASSGTAPDGSDKDATPY